MWWLLSWIICFWSLEYLLIVINQSFIPVQSICTNSDICIYIMLIWTNAQFYIWIVVKSSKVKIMSTMDTIEGKLFNIQTYILKEAKKASKEEDVTIRNIQKCVSKNESINQLTDKLYKRLNVRIWSRTWCYLCEKLNFCAKHERAEFCGLLLSTAFIPGNDLKVNKRLSNN